MGAGTIAIASEGLSFRLRKEMGAGTMAIASEGLSFRLRRQNGSKEKAVDSIFNVDQTKSFIIFTNSEVPGKYKTICKDYIFYIT